MSRSLSDDKREASGSLRAGPGSSGRLFHLMTLLVALAVVALVLIVPLLTGISPNGSRPNGAIAYELPFRTAFGHVMWWLQLIKWLAAASFVLVVAIAIIRRTRHRTTTDASNQEVDQ